MGQPNVASAIWHDRNKRISQVFCGPEGQQMHQTMARDNGGCVRTGGTCESRSEMKHSIPSRTDADSEGVSPYVISLT